MLLGKRKDEESTCICCITEKFHVRRIREDFRRRRTLRGMCRGRWKMASEWCTEL
ncbi:hypothetical protein BRYFOR_09641 [Marvinbryantia formatexigens DSM 14469]|uniref:Uncharacterized protein n=1 Tax=Marvinbryantia formatexigens DSM 14469 TaxID=478749 RepID=C6LLU3_9FIRM|nr:hypothetical protein BRYFOR_09641 [Marvinbryantia formatexigens DSM 14469]